MFTPARACALSVLLHGTVVGLVAYSRAQVGVDRLASPPASSLQARIYTYQQSPPPGGEAREAMPLAGNVPSTRDAAAAQQASNDAGMPSPATPKNTAEVPKTLATPVSQKAETVYDQASLDTSPAVISPVVLEYPASANNREGVVTLEITILGSGEVESVKVLKAVPAGFFEAAAIAGFQKARFSPGLLGGLGVKSKVAIEVEFMPTNRGGTVGGPK
jgi:TonB family protein